MVHCDLTEDEIVRRKQLSDHTRKMICGILNVVAEDDTSIMTTYREFYLQISFSVLHARLPQDIEQGIQLAPLQG